MKNVTTCKRYSGGVFFFSNSVDQILLLHLNDSFWVKHQVLSYTVV